MTTVSNISIGARMAGAAAAKARHGMNEAIARLSTGKRSMYGGDAGGQSIANEVKAAGLSYAVAAGNAEVGISFAQTAESALMELASLAQRLRELGILADNAAFHTSEDTSAMNAEALAITEAMENIMTETKFNDVNVINTSQVAKAVGATDAGDTTTITLTALTDPSATQTADGGTAAADTALGEINKNLGEAAAAMTALKARQAVAYSTASNLLAAASRLEETDFAASSANLAKFSILNQSAMAMVAQANQAQSAVLAVLQ